MEKERLIMGILKNNKIYRKIKNRLRRKKRIYNEINNLKNEIDRLNSKIDNQVAGLSKTSDDIFNCFSKLDSINHNVMIELKQDLNEVAYSNFCLLNKKKYKKKFSPKVSIIIPVYNGENYLSEAIDSALNQSYKNYEIIVVNDGSTDNTEDIVKKYKDKLIYYKKKNGGVSSALNVGIKKMTGDYFLWLSHDDIILPNHIQELVEFIRYIDDKNIIGYSQFGLINSKGEKIPLSSLETCDYLKSLKTHYACILKGDVNGGSILIPKEAFKKVGYFEEGNVISQEKEMWSRLLRHYKFICIPKITYLIRQHDKQVTNTRKDTVSKTMEALLKIIDNIPDEDKIRESGSVACFYRELYDFYSNNGYNDLAKELKKHF